MAEPPDRTAQEREEARLERERRRATGVFNQPQTQSVQSPAESGPADAEHDTGYEDHADHEDDTGYEDHADHEDHPGYEDHADDEDHADYEDHDEELEPAELPAGTRRVSRLDGGRVPRRPRPAKRRPPVPGRKRHSWAGRVFSLVALLLAAGLIWFLFELFQPLGTSPHGRVTVVIPGHSSVSQIGDLLASEGVISSGFFFEVRATLAGNRGDLRSGRYRLQQGMSYSAVLDDLTKAPRAAKTSELTISEGHTRQYVSNLLRRQGVKGNYLAATRSSPLLDPRHYGAPRHVPSLEGFLFPDTFSLIDPIKASALADDQLRDFNQRFAKVNLGYARSRRLSPYDVLKIASLIEAEAASQKARPLVASVIYNRLADGMMLQFDSTTRYATGNFTRPLTESQLHSPSPYNTHTHFGLPPTPINSPGLASIEAAAHPARSHYLYFFAKPCSNATVFATSYAQFQHLLLVDRRNHCP